MPLRAPPRSNPRNIEQQATCFRAGDHHCRVSVDENERARAASEISVWDRIGSTVLRSLAPRDGEVGAIYGLILVGSLMAAESYKQESHLDVLLSVAITLVVYWLAHAYSLVLGRRIERSEVLSLRSLYDGARDSASVLQGALVPLLALLVAWGAGAAPQTSIDIALWSAVATLVCLELIAGLRAKVRPLELALSCCVGAAIGAVVLALKVLLH